jgi:hypothetical protein
LEDSLLIWLSKINPQYRIALDEAWDHERPEIRNPDRRWYEQIPCRGGGFIYLYSEEPPMLGLYTAHVKGARAIMRKIAGLKAEWMDGEAAIYFPPELLDQIAEMAGARKKRQGGQLTAAEKSKLAEAGKAYRFTGKSTGLQTENLPQI